MQAPVTGFSTLLFARHGATEPNLAGLRCGGDIDPPLTALGRQQAVALAQAVKALAEPPDLIVTSDLQRAQDTAAIVRAALGAVDLVVQPAFRERRLGEWNLQPIAATESLLASGHTPPGGESADDFTERIEAALDALLPLLPRRVLLVASKGVWPVSGTCISVIALPRCMRAMVAGSSASDSRPCTSSIGQCTLRHCPHCVRLRCASWR